MLVYFFLCFFFFTLLPVQSVNSDHHDLSIKTTQLVPHLHDEDGSQAHHSVKQLNIQRLSRNEDGGGGGGSENSDSTTSTACLNDPGDRSCCLQYTWPGNGRTQNAPPEDPLSNISRSCADIKVEDPLAACFDPIVYSYSNYSTRPDPEQVQRHCIDNSESCFCAGTTCLKYTLYINDERQTIVNETHFCGTVTETRTNNILTSGCYKEQRGGRIFEVCVCQGLYCNSAPPSNFLLIKPLLLILLSLCLGFFMVN